MYAYSLILKRVPSAYFHALVDEILKTNQFIGDTDFCALSSQKINEVFLKSQWIDVLSSNIEHKIARRLQFIVHSKIEDGHIIVKEDLYYNITKMLGLDVLQESCEVLCEPVSSEFFPKIAEMVKVAPIGSICELTSDDFDSLLSAYFIRPRLLCLNDIFTVPMTMNRQLSKAAMYYSTTEVYYKVISIENHNNLTNDNKSDPKGFFVVKQSSDLYCLSPSQSQLPPKSQEILNKNVVTMMRVPPDLKKYVLRLVNLFTPFTKFCKPECLPFFSLHGCRGTGKVSSLKLTCELLGFHFVPLHSYDIFALGATAVEAKLDYLFQKVSRIGPCILSLSGFELLGRDKIGNEDVRIVNLFLQRTCAGLKKFSHLPIIFVGLCDGKLDKMLPRISRAVVQSLSFDSPSTEEALAAITWFAKKNGVSMDKVDFDSIGTKVTGYVHADLELLVKHGIRLLLEENKCEQILSLKHIEKAIDIMESAYSDAIGAAKVPNVRWEDVGGLQKLKEEVMLNLNFPLLRPQLMASGLRRSGILFYGPPGTGKTLMAKAVATECSMNFLSVKGPELMNMYVGQSERNVREVFERARAATPCILFFDELDSLAPNRGKSGDSGGVTDRVVSQLLAEMDGLVNNRGLFVIAATNRPDLVDPALLRPGRFDKLFYLGPCVDTDSKLSVLRALTNKFILSSDVDLKKVAELLPHQVTGADIYSTCSNAWLSAARRSIAAVQKGSDVKLPLEVTEEDFMTAVTEMVPSLSADDLRYYQQLAQSASHK